MSDGKALPQALVGASPKPQQPPHQGTRYGSATVPPVKRSEERTRGQQHLQAGSQNSAAVSPLCLKANSPGTLQMGNELRAVPKGLVRIPTLLNRTIMAGNAAYLSEALAARAVGLDALTQPLQEFLRALWHALASLCIQNIQS